MDLYEQAQIYTAPQYLWQDDSKHSSEKITELFKRFIKEFRTNSVIFHYRDLLLSNLQKEIFSIEINQEDLINFDNTLAKVLCDKPSDSFPLFEKALKEIVLDLSIQYKNIEDVPDIQFLLNSSSNPRNLRELNSEDVGKLISISGIIVSSNSPSIKAKTMTLQCRNCGYVKKITIASGFGGVNIPMSCNSNSNRNANTSEKCPLNSYLIVPEMCEYIDQQVLKIQETPDSIPTGEIPRSFQIYCERYLINKASPGTRLTVSGIYMANDKGSGMISKAKNIQDINQKPYIKVVGLQLENTRSGKSIYNFSQSDEVKFLNYSKDPKIYEKIAKSVASSLFGNDEIKKAIACLLFGGVRKKLQEGVNLRGDIHVLLLGDPSTGKSQFLKFCERVAPISVYTSGKGSSAAGLTASITKNNVTGEFQLEGGAMVLSDGGIVCIDEFDKMRVQDRVAIHEAMEQQTISVAKAGITTTLNSRTSVLAAANPVNGRLDDFRTTQDQIDFQTTILSRFDCIFLVKDAREVEKDTNLALHIINLHMTGKSNENSGEISLSDLKKYIAYSRMKCTPKISPEAASKLQNYYIDDRKQVAENKVGSKKKNSIPVTVRQLEAIIRLSEAIAKMSLSSFINEKHVDEAHRLFQVSTLNTAKSGHNYNSKPPEELINLIKKIEETIKRRFPIGSKISAPKLNEDLNALFSNSRAINFAISNLCKCDEFKLSDSQKILTRNK